MSWSTRSPGSVRRHRGSWRSTAATSPARACGRRRSPASPTSRRTATSADSCSRSRSSENLALREYRKPLFSAHGWLRLSYWKSVAKRLLKEFDVRGGGPESYAASLSGGNQQKVCVAREIASDPKLLVAHQPTRGLDVGAIEFVHRRLIAERDEGRAVLLVSLEYEEVRALADRILVIYEGEIVGEFPPDAERGGAGHRDDRRERAACGGGACERARGGTRERSRGERRATRARSPAALTAFRRGASGVTVPILTTVIAFIAGGLIVLATGHNPFTTYKSIFDGTGLNWLFPWVSGTERATAAAQPAADADPGDRAAAGRARGRVRVPRRTVQHRRPGPVHRRGASSPSGSVPRSPACRRAAHHVRDRRRSARRRSWAGIAGVLKAAPAPTR